MGQIKKIIKIMKSIPTVEGAGVQLKRVFGFYQAPQLDPFLLLDDFHGTHPNHYIKGFPWHPHRGIETITYMLHGEVEHGDSMGNRGVIYGGDVQWMTAGSGIIHQEMPRGEKNGLMGGFQLWANLPAAQKMMAPRYREIKQSQIPTVELSGGVRIKIISGTAAETRGPVTDIVIEPEFFDVEMPAQTTFTHSILAHHTVFAYVFQGKGCFDPSRDPLAINVEGRNYFDMERDCYVDAGNLVLFGEGEEIQVTTEEQNLRFLLISGKPLQEPIAWGGPIVMNTQEELRRAFDEYHQGTFLQHSSARNASG